MEERWERRERVIRASAGKWQECVQKLAGRIEYLEGQLR